MIFAEKGIISVPSSPMRRRGTIAGRLVLKHVGPVRADHEAGGRGGDGIVLGILVGRGAHKGDGAGDAVADRMRLDVEARRRGLLVIDAQVERGDCARSIERELDGHAAALVEHGGDDAAVKDARLCVADEDRAVGQAGPGFAGRGAVEPKATDRSIDGAAALDGLGERVKWQRRICRRCLGHADVLNHYRCMGKRSRAAFRDRFRPGKRDDPIPRSSRSRRF
jgi:hypothetical protein